MKNATETDNRPAQSGNQSREPQSGSENRAAQTTNQSDRGYITPPANIVGTDNEYLVELEMPGVDKQGIEVTVDGNELTIIGRRKSDIPEGELCYCESPQTDYRRVFELGPDVDIAGITAEMHQGVLTLRLPKSERAKPKQIEVKVV